MLNHGAEAGVFERPLRHRIRRHWWQKEWARCILTWAQPTTDSEHSVRWWDMLQAYLDLCRSLDDLLHLGWTEVFPRVVDSSAVHVVRLSEALR